MRYARLGPSLVLVRVLIQRLCAGHAPGGRWANIPPDKPTSLRCDTPKMADGQQLNVGRLSWPYVAHWYLMMIMPPQSPPPLGSGSSMHGKITERMLVIDLKQWETSVMPCVAHRQHKLR